MADPGLTRAMASQPSAESALVSGLGSCLADFAAKMAVVVGECRAAARVVVGNVIRGLD